MSVSPFVSQLTNLSILCELSSLWSEIILSIDLVMDVCRSLVLEIVKSEKGKESNVSILPLEKVI
jgi:hypothetical protein